MICAGIFPNILLKTYSTGHRNDTDNQLSVHFGKTFFKLLKVFFFFKIIWQFIPVRKGQVTESSLIICDRIVLGDTYVALISLRLKVAFLRLGQLFK